jgi:hypothetical protein
MAEEETLTDQEEVGEEEYVDTAPTSPFLLGFDVADPAIQDVFVNEAFIAVGNTDVSILFGTSIPASDNKFRPVFRAFMSHDTFLNLMNIWASRADFLAKAYEGKPLSLREIEAENPEKFRELYEEMTGVRDGKESEE